MNAATLFDIDQLLELVGQGYIDCIPHPNDEYFMYSTNTSADFRWIPADWPEAAIHAQGLILDREYNVIARPFKKTFLWEEYEGVIPVHTRMVITEKLPGHFCFMYPLPDGSFALATKDGFDVHLTGEANARYASFYMNELVSNVLGSHTPCFIMGFENGFSYLGSINNITGTLMNTHDEHLWVGKSDTRTLWTAQRPVELSPTSLEAIEALDEKSKGMGFLLVINNEFIVNLNFTEFLGYMRMQTISPKLIWEYMKSGKPQEALFEGIPMEFQQWFLGVRTDIARKFVYLRNDIEELYLMICEAVNPQDKKAFADAVRNHSWKGFLFCRNNGGDIGAMCWEAVKPKTEAPYKYASVETLANKLVYL